MFTRLQSPAGLVVYQSDLLTQAGVRHGFSTRHAPHGAPQGQELDLAAVRDNTAYTQLLQTLGCGDHPLVYVKQVHGRRVLTADLSDAASPGQEPQEADGLVTQSPGLALTIRIADCVPILLAGVVDGQPVAVAAVHAGWRGVVAGIIPQAVRALRSMEGMGRGRLVAAVGPCISCRHFEVGPEVAAAFADAGLDAAVHPTPGSKPHIDLPGAARLHLLAAGLEDANVDLGGLCTYDDEADFFSHRRDHGRTGRLAAVIALPGR